MNLKNKIILAPMAAVNNIAFRKLCTDYGADIVYSQMIDAVAFAKGNKRLVDFFNEKNLVAQFFGNDVKSIVEGAKKVEDKVIGVDLNLGCPHSKVVERECGAYLMKFPKRIAAIVSALVKSINVDVTVKIRAGYDRNHINAVEIAKLCEDNGVSAIAVHGRARTVNYEKPVDYDIIKQVKEIVNVPVIGNGDVFDGLSAKRMFDRTGCDSVMVARGAIGNPSIFKEIKNNGKTIKKISKKIIFNKYLRYCKKYNIDFKDIKSHAQWLTKREEGGAKLRMRMNNVKDVEGLKSVYKLIE